MAVNTVLYTNVMALTAKRNLASIGNKQEKSNKRLSSGKKINSATDDAAGLSISSKMKAQIKGLDMAAKNSEDAISLVQTAEGSLTEVSNMLTRVRELTVQASNDTNEQSDRVKIAEEVATLLTEIDAISGRTEFNGKKLNNGSLQDEFFQIGANEGQSLGISVGNMSVFGVGMEELMGTFGVEKYVNLLTKPSTTGIITNVEGVQAKTQTTKIASTVISAGAKLTTAKIHFLGSEKGVPKTFTFEVDLSGAIVGAKSADTVEGADLAKVAIHQLNNNPEFNKLFKAGIGTDDQRIEIKTKNPGGEIQLGSRPLDAQDFKIEFSPDSNGTPHANPIRAFGNVTNTDIIHGHYGQIDFKNLSNGDTIEIAGKTFTKVADSKTAGSIYGGFSTFAELETLLQNDGVVFTKDAANETLKLDFTTQKSPLIGTYSINPKDVDNTSKNYSKMIDKINKSLDIVTEQRAKLGATQNRLEYTINNLKISSQNLSSANSVLEDTDMAKEMMKLTQENVMQQAGISILAQSNQKPNQILDLLG